MKKQKHIGNTSGYFISKFVVLFYLSLVLFGLPYTIFLK